MQSLKFIPSWKPFWKKKRRDSLVVQWLGLGAFTAGARVRSLVGELKSHSLKKNVQDCKGTSQGVGRSCGNGGTQRLALPPFHRRATSDGGRSGRT